MIEVAKSAGFCFGVRRATDSIKELIQNRQPSELICTLGKLIHNEQYNESLKKQDVLILEGDGIDKLKELSKRYEKISLVLRAHGIEKALQRQLETVAQESGNISLVDCTCPFVKKIHQIALTQTTKDSVLIVIGAPDHPEVRSIVSYARGETFVCQNAQELQELLSSGKCDEKEVVLVSQTTQKLTEWKKCQEIIEKHFTNAKIFDTICNVTNERQTEAQKLSSRSDAMIIIGGAESSNTAKLTQVCLANCPCSFQIETADELPLEKLRFSEKIGITAGASTPDENIKEVLLKMMEQENFAELFEESQANSVKIYKGAVVTGIVMAIDENYVCLDLHCALTGILNRDEITSDNTVKLADLFKVGDEVTAKVIDKSDLDGIATLSKKRVDSEVNYKKIAELAENGGVLSGKVVSATDKGLVLDADEVRVFVPASMSGQPKDFDLKTLVGTTQEFKVVELKENKKDVIGSMKAVLNEAKKEVEEKFWNEIEEGKTYVGTVKTLEKYGAFVDLGGVDGLVHITELTWKRIKHPSEVVSVGDELKVYVKSFDKETKRISLGYKAEQDNPWTKFRNQYVLGDIVEVTIVSLTKYGAFANIMEDVDGLIHISQIANEKVENVANFLQVGQTVSAKIIEIDDEKKNISLSIRALLPVEEAPAEETPAEVPAEAPVEVAPVEEAPKEEAPKKRATRKKVVKEETTEETKDAE